MWDTSKTPTLLRTAWCSSVIPAYWIGMLYPANSAIFAPKSMCTYQGYLKSEKQGLQSTKANLINATQEDYFPSSDVLNVKTIEVCYVLVDIEEESVGYIDLTGRFLKRSSRGNQHILVAYHYDTNYIHYVPVKNRKGSLIAAAWNSTHS